MIELIRSVIKTLETIDTHGTQNMQKLLGCIAALNTIIEEEQKSTTGETIGGDDSGRQVDP